MSPSGEIIEVTGSTSSWREDTTRDIWVYGSLFLLVLGTLGNLLTLCVMLRSRLRLSTTAFYLVALAITDTLVLYTGLLRQWIRYTFGLDVRTINAPSCKVHPLLVYFSMHLSSWILVCITLERFAMVMWPIKGKLLCTRSVAMCIVGLITVVLFVTNCHFLWSYELVGGRCDNTEKFNHFVRRVWPWMDLTIDSLGPFLIMLVLNTVMIGQIYIRNLNRKRLGELYTTTEIKAGSIGALLIVITGVFIATSLPLSIHLIRVNILKYSDDLSTVDGSKLDLQFTSFSMVSYLNHAINFLLYCISGKRFRREFMDMLHQRIHRVAPVGEATGI